MGALANGATLVSQDNFKTMVLIGAMQISREIIANLEANPYMSRVLAKAMVADMEPWRPQLTWMVASDVNVSASTTPTEAQILQAIRDAWPHLARMT